MKKVIFWFMMITFVLISSTGCTGTIRGVKHDIHKAYDATKDTLQEIGK